MCESGQWAQCEGWQVGLGSSGALQQCGPDTWVCVCLHAEDSQSWEQMGKNTVLPQKINTWHQYWRLVSGRSNFYTVVLILQGDLFFFFSFLPFLQFILCSCKRSWKFKRSVFAPTEAPLSHRKRCTLKSWRCDITLSHSVTHVHHLCLAASSACENWSQSCSVAVSGADTAVCELTNQEGEHSVSDRGRNTVLWTFSISSQNKIMNVIWAYV